MNEKYLEAWNFIKDQIPNFTFSHLIEEMGKSSDIVNNALQRLNTIDNAESNKDEALKYLEKEIKDLEIKLEKDIKLRDKLTIYQHNALENCVGRISKYESKLKQLNTIKQNLIKSQELEKENAEYKDIEENIGCPFKVIEHLINMIEIFFEKDNKLYIIDDYDIKNNTINFKSGTRLPDYKFCSMNHEVPFTLYGKMFWLKEDKSE